MPDFDPHFDDHNQAVKENIAFFALVVWLVLFALLPMVLCNAAATDDEDKPITVLLSPP